MMLRSRLFGAAATVLALTALASSCGGSGNTATSGGATCTPNAQVSCACLGGTTGIQVCNADGRSLGMCQCGTTSGTGGSTGTVTPTTTASGTGGGTTCQCTDPGGEIPYCGAAICNDGGMTTSSTTTSSSSGACAGMATFAGVAPMQMGSNWSYGGQVGLAAGTKLCQDMGADHVCDYDDLTFAASQNELTAVPTTTMAWLYRTHSVTVGTKTPPVVTQGGTPGAMGTTFKVGSASRCADWTYSTDHLNDGEWVDFSTGSNSPTYHFDNNPCVIESPNPGKDSPCGHNALNRSVLCCFPKNTCTTVAPDTCTCSNGMCM